MAACASVAPATIDSAPGDLDVPVPLTRQRDVINVLATMVLTIAQEVTA